MSSLFPSVFPFLTAGQIEVVYDASHAPAVPAPKPLTERVAQKAQPKPATAPKAKDTAAGKKGVRGRARKGRNPGRGKPKSKEELDAEMLDYFNENATGNAPVNGTVQANGGEDLGMAEISVRLCRTRHDSSAFANL